MMYFCAFSLSHFGVKNWEKSGTKWDKNWDMS